MKRSILCGCFFLAAALAPGVGRPNSKVQRTHLAQPWPKELLSAFPRVTHVVIGAVGSEKRLREVARRLVGRDLDFRDYVRLLAAPDGARIAVWPSSAKSISLQMLHPFYARSGFMRLEKNGTGLSLQHETATRSDQAPPKLGTYQHAQRILQAVDLFPGMVLKGIGRRTRDHSGAMSFARLGYTMKLPKKFGDIDLAQLNLSGRLDEWEQYEGPKSGAIEGHAPTMEFHTRAGSPSRKIFAQFLEVLPRIELPVYEITVRKTMPQGIADWLNRTAADTTTP